MHLKITEVQNVIDMTDSELPEDSFLLTPEEGDSLTPEELAELNNELVKGQMTKEEYKTYSHNVRFLSFIHQQCKPKLDALKAAMRDI